MKVLLAAELPSIAERFETLKRKGFTVESVSVREQWTAILGDNHYDLIFFEISFLPNFKNDPLGAFSKIKQLRPGSKFIVLGEQAEIRECVDLVKIGVDNYLTFPVDEAELQLIVDKIIYQERKMAELAYLRDQFWERESLEIVSTSSPKMEDVYAKIKDVAPTKSTVLIQGETGVGKGVMARLIHQHSSRKKEHFIHVHCGAISENLLESELFGHEKGAFTGAIKRKLGKFELANKGTIFLDEVSTLSPSAQIKLLQVLQEATFQRVGGESDVNVDVRIVSATNEKLDELVKQGLFRSDLFYRLNVFPLNVPPLKERLEDIPHLVEALLISLRKTHFKEILGVRADTIEALQKYSWPGNIRELENLVERAYIIEKSSVLTRESFPLDLDGEGDDHAMLPLNGELPLAEARVRTLESFERQYLKELLVKTGGRISTTAERAGIGVRQLNKLMNKYSLHKEQFKNTTSTGTQVIN